MILIIQGTVLAASGVDSWPCSFLLQQIHAQPQAKKSKAKGPMPYVTLREMKEEKGQLTQDLKNGQKVVFTLDPKVQRKIDGYLKTYKVPYGAVVLMEPRSGVIRALVGDSCKEPVKEELCRRVFAPAASIFKIVTSAILLEQKKIKQDTQVCFTNPGLSRLNMSHLRVPPKGKGTCMDVGLALAKSTNTVFALLANKHLNKADLARGAKAWGFGTDLGFDLTLQKSAFTTKEDALELARTAAGFGDVWMSPVHGAVIASIVATGGARVEPRVVNRIEGKGPAKVKAKKGPVRAISKSTAKALKAMMAKTPLEGTGRRAFTQRLRTSMAGVDVAGKTGTLSAKGIRYTWFIGFAPVDKPTIAIAAVVGNSPKWRIKGTDLAAKSLEIYFQEMAQREAKEARAAKAKDE